MRARVILSSTALVVIASACGRGTFDFPGEPVDGSTTTSTIPSGQDGGTAGGQDASANMCDGGPCSCPAGKVVCANACVALASNPLHCGACGVRCDGPTPVCNAGECRAQCTGGRSACAGACVDLKSDNDNCGECALACGEEKNCNRSACDCLAGQILCGNRCTNTMTDSNNCGECGRGCPQATVCGGGVCQ